MDTQAPTTPEKLAEEGTLAPSSTPIRSETSSRTPRQFEAHSSSPLHASSRSSLRRTPRTGVDSPEEGHGEESRGATSRDSSVRPTDKARKRRRILRRPYGGPKRHSSNSTSDGNEDWVEEQSKRSWVTLMRQSRYNPSIVLKNTGAVARDHLASERTFLAYVRTSMGLASMGVALVQLFAIADITTRALGTPVPTSTPDVQRFARPLGALTIALALAVLLIGMYRYFKIQFTLPSGNFPIARISAAFTSFVFSAIVVTIFAAVLSGRT